MTSRAPSRRSLLMLVVGIAIVTMAVLYQVLPTVFFALTVASVLLPLRKWLLDKGLGRTTAAALSTIAAVMSVLLLVVPVLVALYVRRTKLIDFLKTLPSTQTVSAFGFTYSLELSSIASTVRRLLASVAPDIATGAPIFALKLMVFILLVYALLLYPDRFKERVFNMTPPEYKPVLRTLSREMRLTLNAIYILQAATAFATFIIAYAVFALLGIEAAMVLAVLSGILQFIPVVGPSVIILALAAYEVVIGTLQDALLITILGLVLIGFLPDALVRPRLASITTDLPVSVYFAGFVGGILTLGFIGFIAGPLAAALLLEMTKLLAETNGDGEIDPEAPVADTEDA